MLDFSGSQMRAKRVGLLWFGVQHACATGEKEINFIFYLMAGDL